MHTRNVSEDDVVHEVCLNYSFLSAAVRLMFMCVYTCRSQRGRWDWKGVYNTYMHTADTSGLIIP